MKHKLYLYPKWIRAWHWINAIMFIILIVTGISMQYTDKKSYQLMVNFDMAVAWHNIAALILTASYIIFVTGNILTGNGKHYRLKKENMLKDLITQFKYYAHGMFKGENHPFPITEDNKFNPLQKFTYIFAMYLGMPVLIITGIALLLPEINLPNVFGVSGILLTDILHITVGFFLSVFMIIHLYTCTLGSKPTTLFKGMITGYHETDH